VLVTSRSRLAGLPGAAHTEADVLDAGKSLDLLARIAGADRVQAKPLAAAEVAEQCGHLPLALRIAGARLSARPHWSIQQLTDRLADETRRLDGLRHGDMGIRASISLTFEGASEQARRLLRRLALLEQSAFSGGMSAALLDLPLADAEDLLDELVTAHLVEIMGTGSGVHAQYRFHELIRVFARERLAAEEPAAERQAALGARSAPLLYLAIIHRLTGRLANAAEHHERALAILRTTADHTASALVLHHRGGVCMGHAVLRWPEEPALRPERAAACVTLPPGPGPRVAARDGRRTGQARGEPTA
jgi:hypothetical protein